MKPKVIGFLARARQAPFPNWTLALTWGFDLVAAFLFPFLMVIGFGRLAEERLQDHPARDAAESWLTAAGHDRPTLARQGWVVDHLRLAALLALAGAAALARNLGLETIEYFDSMSEWTALGWLAAWGTVSYAVVVTVLVPVPQPRRLRAATMITFLSLLAVVVVFLLSTEVGTTLQRIGTLLSIPAPIPWGIAAVATGWSLRGIQRDYGSRDVQDEAWLSPVGD